MREIKFRAWWKSLMRMLDADDVRRNLNIGVIAHIGEVADYILMQYTGLKDKNGREIYEGDIVISGMLENDVWVPRNGIVEWEQGDALFRIKLSDAIDDDQLMDGPCEVIGNIYESPELLK
jgi:uncharacterized phage protein (TIGR01671 family)